MEARAALAEGTLIIMSQLCAGAVSKANESISSSRSRSEGELIPHGFGLASPSVWI